MSTYDEIKATSRPGRAFSNGTSWEIWSAGWCFKPCVNDRNEDCPLILFAMTEDATPGEWIETGLQDYQCIEFRGESDGPSPEPTPIPDPPGQSLLLPREPFEGVRMFAGVVEQNAAVGASS